MKFKTTILQTGYNTGIEVPPDVVEGWAAARSPPWR